MNPVLSGQVGRDFQDNVVIVGAGIIGLACAYSLATRGVQSVIIDKERPGSGASSGNAGHIAFAPEIVAPVPGPRVLRTSLVWLVQPDSPLRLIPRLEWDYLRWLGRFVVSCAPDAASAGLNSTMALNAETAELFDDLEREGLEFEMKRLGMLIVFGSRRSFDAARRKMTASHHRGAQGCVLSREEALDAEPLLDARACFGAVRYEKERQIRPDKLIDALVARLKQMDVEFRTETACIEVIRDGRRVVGLRTTDETIRGRAYVFAPGVCLSRLTEQVGLRIPVEAGKGYSFDVPPDRLPLRAPVYVYDGRLALTPFNDFTRVVGMMELGARTTTVRPRAIETMNRVGASSFRNWPADAVDMAWAGLRPMTPDGLPVIGAVSEMENLYVAGGHGMLGVTLSLRTGEAIAKCIKGDQDDPVLLPFAPSRFTMMRRGGGRRSGPHQGGFSFRRSSNA